ncbi:MULTISPECIES: DUF4326 domain-containing protein [unclassified Actinopolyspora]|uniref:DUF4326 domain-containing protein n=1 Tax=Actinopolyspora TaxID=1849 RepID=UPI0013F60653|nr:MULTISPECIES: DUF4326 domain-containing protein [unclassified Actinopolyspora]NHD16803.1 DUF4326 domain-containing protein [Actinopolyspora sp. BKK2]NHE75334.1 DUF4326 domain-containing protein [Actinopolyspora sp. BKK1]
MSERSPSLPEGAETWSEDERERARRVLAGRATAVNVRRNGPHRRLVPWLLSQDLLTYVGHRGGRHGWPESDFASPFVKQARTDRVAARDAYEEWLNGSPELLRRIDEGELAGRALGCWCAPEPCHAEVLARRAGRGAG